ncbi:MAG: cytochrome P450 [Minicystis sp.]
MLSASPRGLPPGPAISSFRQGARFGTNPFAFLEECARAYGDCFTLRLPGDPPRVVCSNPEDVRRIFALEPDRYASHDVSIPLNLGERSLLFLDGDKHLADRRLMVPPLHGEHLDGYGRLMQAIVQRALTDWPRGEPVSFHARMQWVTLSVIMGCVFGIDEEQRLSRLRTLTTEWLDGTLTPLVFLISVAVTASRVRRFLDAEVAKSRDRPDRGAPWRFLPWQRLADTKSEIERILGEEIDRAKAEGAEGRSDVLAMLVRARYEDGGAMEQASLLDELLTLLVGGHETTANALCWAMMHLLQNPETLAAARAELDAAFPEGAVDPARARKLPYLEACIKESMRLSPIAPAVGRTLTQPLSLTRAEIPAGTILWPCVYLTHRRADLWPEPTRFQPQRFLGEQKLSPNQFFPFGGGRRRCTGMVFAGMEMQIVLAELLLRAELRLAPTTAPAPVMRGITVSPADGLRVVYDGPRRRPSS